MSKLGRIGTSIRIPRTTLFPKPLEDLQMSMDRSLHFLHSPTMQYAFAGLLLLDILVLFGELLVLSYFPHCSVIVRDAVSCCYDYNNSDHTNDNNNNNDTILQREENPYSIIYHCPSIRKWHHFFDTANTTIPTFTPQLQQQVVPNPINPTPSTTTIRDPKTTMEEPKLSRVEENEDDISPS
jgi:hypothetical protein